jgi:chromate transporter
LLLIWLVILIAVIALRNAGYPYDGSGQVLYWFESFYRTGSIIYGGGQVVLPLLLEEVVKYQSLCTAGPDGAQACNRVPDYTFFGNFSNPAVRSWVTEEQFLAGLGIAQAMPGPLFNFAAYLGALIAARAGVNLATGVSVAWLGLFAPGILIIFGTLPFWAVFRKFPAYRRALPGMNAAAVGLVVAAVFGLYDKVRTPARRAGAAARLGLAADGCSRGSNLPFRSPVRPVSLSTAASLAIPHRSHTAPAPEFTPCMLTAIVLSPFP